MNRRKKQELLSLLRQYKVDRKNKKFDRVYTGQKTFNNEVKKIIMKIIPNVKSFKKKHLKYVGYVYHIYDNNNDKVAQVVPMVDGYAQENNVPKGLIIQINKELRVR